jgi:hypothetical protein
MFGLETGNFLCPLRNFRVSGHVKSPMFGIKFWLNIDEKRALFWFWDNFLLLFYFSVQNLSEKLLEKVLFNPFPHEHIVKNGHFH